MIDAREFLNRDAGLVNPQFYKWRSSLIFFAMYVEVASVLNMFRIHQLFFSVRSEAQ